MICVKDPNRPFSPFGAVSDMYIGTTTTAIPEPSPEMHRPITRAGTEGARAESRAPAMYGRVAMRMVERRPRREDRGPDRIAPLRPPRVKIEFTSPISKDVMGMHCGREKSGAETEGRSSFSMLMLMLLEMLSSTSVEREKYMERRLQVMTS